MTLSAGLAGSPVAELDTSALVQFSPSHSTAVLEQPPAIIKDPVVVPKPRSTRYQSLDMWRGVACLMLVIYHAAFYASHTWKSGDPSTWTLGGLVINLIGRLWIGVPIFFVVSGYCIAASSDSSRKRPHSLRTYFSRRFRRIYPPLWIALALCVLFVLLVTTSESIRQGCAQLPQLREFTPGNWLANLTATESWRPNISGGENVYVMKNTWTLCYEEQFYAVVGLMLLVSAQRFFAAAGVVTVLTLAARHLTRTAGISMQGFFCDGHWLMFAVGILVYYRLHYAPGRLRWLITAGLVGVIAYAVADHRLSATHFDKHLDEYLVASASFGLLAIGLYRKDEKLVNSRLLQPLFWYGKMSYSVYLTHFPVVVVVAYVLARIGSSADWFAAAVTVPLCVAITVPLGRVFHLVVERRFMNTPLESKRAAV